MHVPAENDGAEAEARGRDGEEFVLGDQLAAQYAVCVDAGELDVVVVLEDAGERVEG